MAGEKHWYLICYDIREPAVWRKVFKIVKSYGQPLQYSIFRARLSPKQKEKMRWDLSNVMKEDDSLLIIRLCRGCSERIISKNVDLSWVDKIETFTII